MQFLDNTKESRVVNVVDAPMGGGKTSAAIRYINGSPREERVMFISPYVDEGIRVEGACREKGMVSIVKTKGAKLNDLREKLLAGKSVAGTHALFSVLTDDILDLVEKRGYTLIIDETCTVTAPATGKMRDQFTFMDTNGYLAKDSETGVISFLDDQCCAECSKAMPELSKFIQSGAVHFYNGKDILLWTLPDKNVNAFRRVIVLTYLYDAQPLSYYLRAFGYRVNHVGVHMDADGGFSFCPVEEGDGFRFNVREKLHIVQDEKFNRVGNGKCALSASWYKRSVQGDMKKFVEIRNRIRGVQKNHFRCKLRDFIWTSFSKYAGMIGDKNIKSRFVECNRRAVNDYGDCHYLAYAIGLYTHPDCYNYFLHMGYTMDTDKWALSEMLQWIWRSAIRNGEEIWVYVPSRRMRELLEQWVDQVSDTYEKRFGIGQNTEGKGMLDEKI